MFKLKWTNFPKNKLLQFNTDLSKFNLFKYNNLNAKNFSIKAGGSKNTHQVDFYESNFKLESPPESISAFNDLDSSFATEVFSKFDLENLCTLPMLEGRFSRIWCFTEDTIHHIIMFMTHEMSLGIGFSTVILAGLLRLVFFPLYKRNFKNLQINRLLQPDSKDFQDKVHKLKQAGESRLVVIETEKWKKLQKENGIKTNFLTMGLNMFQGIILVCWAGLVQRFSFNVEDYPEMMTGGFLWFKDLSMSDPYLILPLINSLAMNTNAHFSSVSMQKIRRFLFIAPVFSSTIMCTFETGFILYFATQSILMVIINSYLARTTIKKKLGVLNFLPGSKLERLNKFRLVGDKIESLNIQPTSEETISSEENTQNKETPIKKTASTQQAKKEKAHASDKNIFDKKRKNKF